MKKNRKTAFIIVRVLQVEKDRIIQKADKLGQSISTFVRIKLGIDDES